jgi:imidazolonepropionase-like amidohydrolase
MDHSSIAVAQRWMKLAPTAMPKDCRLWNGCWRTIDSLKPENPRANFNRKLLAEGSVAFSCELFDATASAFAGCLCHHPAFARVNAIASGKFSRRSFLRGAAAMAAFPMLDHTSALAGTPAAPSQAIAFTNVKVFDGTSDALRGGLTVMVEGSRIKSIGPATGSVEPGIRVIDGGGRTLMPGLIDAHWHAMMAAIGLNQLLTADVGYINLVAADQAEKTLLRGFTSIRDMAGPVFGLKRAIDTGLVSGPRIWPSGAMISQTSGHGDFRFPYEVPAAYDAPMSRGEVAGGGMIADGVDQVLKRVREQLMLGATQIKLSAGGGIASNYDPLDVSQYTEAEFRAAVEAAENWGTYVAVHAYTPRAIKMAVNSGVRCLEHGQLMDEATAALLAEKDTWFSSQPFLDDEDANPQPEGSPNRAKQLEMSAGTDTAFGLAKKYRLKTAWGTDTLFEPKLTNRQGAQLAKMKRWYTPIEILKMATGTNAELLAMSGPRNPYPGKVGVLEEGAFADILLVDGDPTTDIDLVADPVRNFKIIMKDGRFHKNELQE